MGHRRVRLASICFARTAAPSGPSLGVRNGLTAPVACEEEQEIIVQRNMRTWRRRLSALSFLTGFAIAAAPVSTARCANGLPDDGSFFPIAVWLQSPTHATEYRAIGVNLYLGLDNGPTEEQLAVLSANGMFVIANQNQVGLTSKNRGVIKGWLYERDEPDNAQPIGGGRYGPCVPAAEVAQRVREIKSRDPTRPVMVGFGQAVADPHWVGRGSCTGDMGYYEIARQGADIVGFDIYPVGSDSPEVKGKLEYVAHGVDFLREKAPAGQAVWNAIETTALDPAHPVRPDQVRSEVWMSIIHGSAGIVYFVHEFKPIFGENAIFRHPDVVDGVRATNKLIENLAPVLNSKTVDGRVATTSAEPISTMVKEYGSAIYLFAVVMNQRPTDARFKLGGVRDGVAEVLGEYRRVPVLNGVIEDHFVGYGVHIYKMPVAPGE